MVVHEISSSSQIPRGAVIIDFYATWCKPCKTIAPTYEKLSTDFPAVKFLKVNVDECPELVIQFAIKAMPTFIFLHNHELRATVSGSDMGKFMRELVKLNGSA
jgi:thioredoxin 1